MSARTHTQRCPSRTSAPSLSPPPPDVLICSCAHPHPPHTHPPRFALSAPSLVPPFLPHHPRPNRSVRPRRPTRLPITRRKARTNCPRPHPPCTHRPLSRRFSRAVPLAPSHLHPPSLVPPFLPHLRPHRAHGATPHDRPDAPLSRRSPAPPARRHPSAPAPVPAPRKKSARLPAEVLKLQDFSFYQSISNFIVS